MSRGTLMSVARVSLTFATLLAGLVVLAFLLPSRGDWILWFVMAVAATATPVVALVYAAPTFRIKQYVLNGGLAALGFPILAYLLYDADGIEDPAPQWLFAVILLTGPAALSLSITALSWAMAKRLRRGRQAR